MKNIFKILLVSILSAVTFLSCTKKENKIYFNGGTAPVLSASLSGNIPLSFVNRNNVGLKVMWTNPNYQFTTGLSSQDVSYQLEIDTTGANFTNPRKVIVSIGKDLSKTFTQDEINSILFSQMKLLDGMSHNIEMRLRASLPNDNGILYSNVLKFTATPYTIPPKVAVPTTNALWITGSAVGSGWSNPIGAPNESLQKFTRVTNTLYELTVNMISGGGYKILQENNGNWSSQYSYVAGSGSALGGEFEKRDGTQFDAPSVSGTYKLTFDFQAGRFTAVKQ